MSQQVFVSDELVPGKIAVAFAPGATEAIFRARFCGPENPLWSLTDFLMKVRYADNRDWRYKRFHRTVSARVPQGWKVLFPDQISLSTKYEFMDWLVEHFDADVEWPEYQSELQNLRTRRERLRQWRSSEPRRGGPARPALPKEVILAYRSLKCDVGAEQDVVARAYKQLSLKHHPDRGGSQAQMVQLNKAMAVLRAHFARPAAAPIQ